MGKKLGDLVKPVFDRMGAKADYDKHGPGTVTYTATHGQLRHFFEEDPVGKAVMAICERSSTRDRLMPKKRKKRG